MHKANQAAGFGRIDGVLTGQFGERIDVQWFAERQQLQRVVDVLSGLIQPALHQRGKARRHGGRPPQLPDVIDSGQGSGVDRSLHQMPQEQWVAAGRLPHQIGGQALERAADDRLHEGDALLLGERLQLNPA